jgi:hypothetical protein
LEKAVGAGFKPAPDVSREKLQIPLNPPLPKGDFNTPFETEEIIEKKDEEKETKRIRSQGNFL